MRPSQPADPTGRGSGTRYALPQPMTAPRCVLPGTTYLVTRRCSQRALLLRPSEEVNAIVLFVLAVAARRYRIQVHAFCVMSNHVHLVVTDPYARLPAFAQYLGSLVARAMNASLRRWESFWAPGSYSAVALCGPEDVLAKAAYVLANPVAAGLVRSGREWPGLWSAPEQIGSSAIRVRRPTAFFRAGGSLPEAAELELALPPGFASADDFRLKLTAALSALEEQAATDHQGRFLGRKRVLSQKPGRRPPSGEERRGLNPRVAGMDKWKRIEALTRLVEFLRAYRRAFAARRAGSAEVVFPAGTYLLRIAHGVACVPA